LSDVAPQGSTTEGTEQTTEVTESRNAPNRVLRLFSVFSVVVPFPVAALRATAPPIRSLTV